MNFVQLMGESVAKCVAPLAALLRFYLRARASHRIPALTGAPLLSPPPALAG
jgi:hypothetical protein